MKLDDITPEAVGGGVFGIGMIAFFLKKLIVSFVQSDKIIAAVEAETDVIKLLRSEVEQLSKALVEMHQENLALQREVSNLNDKLNDVTEQLSSLKRLRERS